MDDEEDPTDQNTPYMRKVRALLTTVFGKFHATTYGGEGERTVNRLAVVAGISAAYLRAVAKVGFHYFLWACQSLRGDEPAFAPLRAFIADGQGEWRDFVQLEAPQFLPLLREGKVPMRTSHFFFAALRPQQAAATVQFFVGPQSLPSPSRVRLATNPLTVDAKAFACHQACYFDDDADRVDGHDGELLAIDVWERRIIRPYV